MRQSTGINADTQTISKSFVLGGANTADHLEVVNVYNISHIGSSTKNWKQGTAKTGMIF